MVKSKTNIHSQDIVGVYKSYSMSSGIISRKDFIRAIKDFYKVSDPTANKILRKFSDIFIVEDGMVRLREDLVVIEPQDEPELYKKSHHFLDKLSSFLSSREDVGEFLIKISSVRDEFMDGVYSGLEKLLIQLDLRFGVEVEDLIEEGKEFEKLSEYYREDVPPEKSGRKRKKEEFDDEDEEILTEEKDFSEEEEELCNLVEAL